MNNETPKVSEAEEGFSGCINYEQWHRAFRKFWRKRGMTDHTFNGRPNNERDTTDTTENL